MFSVLRRSVVYDLSIAMVNDTKSVYIRCRTSHNMCHRLKDDCRSYCAVQCGNEEQNQEDTSDRSFSICLFPVHWLLPSLPSHIHTSEFITHPVAIPASASRSREHRSQQTQCHRQAPSASTGSSSKSQPPCIEPREDQRPSVKCAAN